MVFFSVGWTPIQALYPAEVLSYENRAKGLALQGIVTNSVSLINTFGLPSALAALTWKSQSSLCFVNSQADNHPAYLIFGCAPHLLCDGDDS